MENHRIFNAIATYAAKKNMQGHVYEERMGPIILIDLNTEHQISGYFIKLMRKSKATRQKSMKNCGK